MLMQVRNWLRGSLQVDIRGAAVERFLNLCAIHGVAFWKMETLDIDHFTAWVSLDGYAALHPYARRTGCRVRVTAKRGVPFAAAGMTRRKGLWLGLLACAALTLWLSGFVWTIRVEGCETTTPEEILTMMEQVGLRTGVRRRKLDNRTMQNQVMTMTDKLSYFTLNFQGTRAIVWVWEKQNPVEKPEELPPCDVVSEVTGVVTALRVRTGKAQVKVGDTVRPGDMIATGVIVNENDETRVTLLRADAEADVRTWYTVQTAVPDTLGVLDYDGRVSDRYCLLLGNRRIPLGIIEKNTVLWYDKQIKTHYLRLHEDFRWPVALERQQTLFCTAKEASVDRDALAELLQRRMLDRLLAEKPGALVQTADFTLEQSPKGAWLGVLKVELVETTGRQVPMG
ncbi:MAG: sporulation protein YqfD [Clostridia bacterium]|nr:sporulation protein YqfD [Clostridia bacterium]